MAMASDDNTGRRQAIVMAITAELERQAHDGTMPVDIEALAAAIEQAIGGDRDVVEGRHPDELNATNDD